MIIITDISEKFFELNGIRYAKIYQPLKQGLENIGIYNIYDTKGQLQNSERFDQYEIDGTVYGSQLLAMEAILDVVISTLSDSDFDILEGRVSILENINAESRLTNLENNQVTGVETYDELTDLPVTGTLLVSYKVTNDTISSSNNGYYHWNGSAYIKDASLVENEIDKANTSDGVSGFATDKFAASIAEAEPTFEIGTIKNDGSETGSTTVIRSQFQCPDLINKISISVTYLLRFFYYDKSGVFVGAAFGTTWETEHELLYLSTAKYVRIAIKRFDGAVMTANEGDNLVISWSKLTTEQIKEDSNFLSSLVNIVSNAGAVVNFDNTAKTIELPQNINLTKGNGEFIIISARTVSFISSSTVFTGTTVGKLVYNSIADTIKVFQYSDAKIEGDYIISMLNFSHRLGTGAVPNATTNVNNATWGIDYTINSSSELIVAQADIQTSKEKLNVALHNIIINLDSIMNFNNTTNEIELSENMVVLDGNSFTTLTAGNRTSVPQSTAFTGTSQGVLVYNPVKTEKLFVYQYSDSFEFGGIVIATLNYDLRMGTGAVPNAAAKIINVNSIFKTSIDGQNEVSSAIYEDFLTRNSINDNKVWQAIKSTDFSILHFTDLHNKEESIEGIKTSIERYIPDVAIQGGDLTRLGPNDLIDTWDFFKDFLDVTSTPILMVMGQHEVGFTDVIAESITQAEAFQKYINPYLATMDLTDYLGADAYTNNLCYFFKDYTVKKIRVIVPFQYEAPLIVSGDPLKYTYVRGTLFYSQAQIDWLITTLNSVQVDYNVIIALHQADTTIVGDSQLDPKDDSILFAGNVTPANKVINGDIIGDIINAYITRGVISSVNYTSTIGETLNVNCDFSSANGKFVAYTGGDRHKDFIGIVNLSGFSDRQRFLGCSSYGEALGHIQVENTKSWDLMNVYGFDTVNEEVKIARIGADVGIEMNDTDMDKQTY